jgi:hypothetical protein
MVRASFCVLQWESEGTEKKIDQDFPSLLISSRKAVKTLLEAGADVLQVVNVLLPAYVFAIQFFSENTRWPFRSASCCLESMNPFFNCLFSFMNVPLAESRQRLCVINQLRSIVEPGKARLPSEFQLLTRHRLRLQCRIVIFWNAHFTSKFAIPVDALGAQPASHIAFSSFKRQLSVVSLRCMWPAAVAEAAA